MRKLAAVLSLFMILYGCASVEVDQSTANFDENELAVDLNTCRHGHLRDATFETVNYSTVGGAVGAIHGLSASVHADSIESMIIGAAADSVFSAGAGVYNGLTERRSEIVMEKGYTITHQAS